MRVILLIIILILTNGGLSIKRLQLLSSVGELSSSELADLDAIFCMFVISQLEKRYDSRLNISTDIFFSY